MCIKATPVADHLPIWYTITRHSQLHSEFKKRQKMAAVARAKEGRKVGMHYYDDNDTGGTTTVHPTPCVPITPITTQAKQEAEGKSQPAKPKAANAAEDEDEEVDAARYRELRLAAVAAIKAKGGTPYPHKFATTCRIPEYVAKYQDSIEAGSVVETETVALAGRVWTKRASGAKLVFYDLHGDGAKVQIMADARHSELDGEGFGALHAASRRGDIVGVVGYPARTKKGELSVVPKHFEVLSPCLHQLPKGPTGITNQVYAITLLHTFWLSYTPTHYVHRTHHILVAHAYIMLITHAHTSSSSLTGNSVSSAVPRFDCQPSHSQDFRNPFCSRGWCAPLPGRTWVFGGTLCTVVTLHVYVLACARTCTYQCIPCAHTLLCIHVQHTA